MAGVYRTVGGAAGSCTVTGVMRIVDLTPGYNADDEIYVRIEDRGAFVHVGINEIVVQLDVEDEIALLQPKRTTT